MAYKDPENTLILDTTKGDVVIEMAFETVETPDDALLAMDEALGRSDQPLLLRVYRRGQTLFEAIDIEVRG